MFEEERLLALLRRWSAPILPGFIVDATEEMQQEAARLGETAAQDLASLLASKTAEKIDHLETLGLFCLEYLEMFPEPMTEALLGQLGAKDPHQIVELLVDAYAPDMSFRLIKGVRLDFENHALLDALIDALTHQGDDIARKFLSQLPREKLTPELTIKLDKELAWLARNPHHRRRPGKQTR